MLWVYVLHRVNCITSVDNLLAINVELDGESDVYEY